MQRINRLSPKMPAGAYKTYQIASPVSTHTRVASCHEVDCQALAHGWRTVVDENTDLGARQAALIRQTCRPTSTSLASSAGMRRYTEALEGGLTVFTFAAGQRCFAEHRAPLGRPELFIVRDGDWRGNPRRTQARKHSRPEYWVEDFAEHQNRIATAIEKG